MIFQHTWEKVLSGEKTQTRRIVKAGDFANIWYLNGDDDTRICEVLTPNHKVDKYGMTMPRNIYLVGKTYAVQTGRGKASVARIRITDIRHEDVRGISLEDAKAEGFLDEYEFMRVWLSMHDKEIYRHEYWGMKTLGDRPAERYQAWALTFELVQA